jgi:RNA polymerase sigma-70 factor (ECF subfamily)
VAADLFPSTQWSLVARAGGRDGASCAALGELCGRYWYPIYAFFRRWSRTREEAEDLTQGFFEHLLAGESLAAVTPAHGKFRGFLLACARHYVVDQHRRNTAARRGGDVRTVALDFRAAADRFDREPAHDGDPDRLFLRSWAMTLLDRTAAALRADYTFRDRADLFDRLRPALAGDPDAGSYREAGEALGMTENAVKKAAQELRRRYGEELRRQIADTVSDPGDVDDELRDLFAAVSG